MQLAFVLLDHIIKFAVGGRSVKILKTRKWKRSYL